MTDNPTPVAEIPKPPEKDELFPLISVIQGLILWAQKKHPNIKFDMTNSYCWPPLPAGPISDADHYKTFIIAEFDRVMDWNMPIKFDEEAFTPICDAILKYVQEMKPATGAQ